VPTIFNCPACQKETYRELPKCPNCGEVFLPDLVDPVTNKRRDQKRASWTYYAERNARGHDMGAIILAIGFFLFGIGAATWQILFEFGFLDSGPFG